MCRALLICLLVLGIAAPAFAQERRQRWRDFSPEEWQNERREWESFQNQINALGAQRVEQIPVPVIGVPLAAIVSDFGDPRGDGTRLHEGQDIMAPRGTPIASPTDAVVVRAGDGESSGLYVRTMNPGGESFVYMHLSRIGEDIEQGKVLKRGDIIGFVGDTGNAVGAGPHLHFEIRTNWTATDPLPRLAGVFTADEEARIRAAAEAQGVPLPAGLKLQSAAPPAAPAASNVFARIFPRELERGMEGDDVRFLQMILNGVGFRVSETGPGSPGNESAYFGPATEAALARLQKALGITPASGYFGPKTRALFGLS